MRMFNNLKTIDFMGRRRVFMGISIILVAVSFVSFAVRGFNFAIDFTGGIIVEMAFPQAVELNQIRRDLAEAGHQNAAVQYFGSAREVMIRLPPQGGAKSTTIGDQVRQAVNAHGGHAQVRRVQFVGPQVGGQLAEQGSLALLYTLIGVLIYVMLRFEWRFSLGAVIALCHDTIITAGVFSLFHLNFDLTVLAALLAVIGYSVNDTIVVYDRIRENFPRIRKGSVAHIFNASVTQTLSRTIITSLTVILVLLALYLLGGSSIDMFALAMMVGTVAGTYSSIFVASALTLELGVSREDMMPKPKTEQDEV